MNLKIIKHLIKAWTCFFIGHDEPYEDSAYWPTCNRCNGNFSYDKNHYKIIPEYYLRMKWKAQEFKDWIFKRCSDCSKPSRICGKSVGDHEDCLPF